MQQPCRKAPITNDPITIGKLECLEFSFKDSPYAISISPATYLFELWGAAGGYSTHGKINEGGNGGYASGYISLRSKRTFFLYTGGQGGNSTTFNVGVGGFNGGANGGLYHEDCPSAGSGGATDIRLTMLKDNVSDSLSSRIMVAGGGGSAGCWKDAGAGGHGGGISGISGNNSIEVKGTILLGGEGGSQLSGYKLGQGEVGEAGGTNYGEAGGSGGGGYFGGFGGKSGCNACSGGGGGGGSSFISGHQDCIAVDHNGNSLGSSIHPSGLFFKFASTISGLNPNNGKAIIRWIPATSQSKCGVKSFLLTPFLLFISLATFSS